ncbi:hypothetical protein ArsFIN_20830 [Arsenophonus nasoniae]|uniref:Uncharacterized protein n=1 Tax=Arsenophonus nasoniae TaxID=638 RepID=A0A4P7KUI2_9GAMM|nr:hypothetical protein ArsFIN_20830 [Arsenophonus nasoniae]
MTNVKSTYEIRRFEQKAVSAVFLVSGYLLEEIEWQTFPRCQYVWLDQQ